LKKRLKRALSAFAYYGPEIGLCSCLFKFAWFTYPIVPESEFRFYLKGLNLNDVTTNYKCFKFFLFKMKFFIEIIKIIQKIFMTLFKFKPLK
jgi:hypothetical protein